MKLTKQGVRDLNDPIPKNAPIKELPKNCEHKRMKTCHPKCGHWYCPDCDLTWDDGAGI